MNKDQESINIVLFHVNLPSYDANCKFIDLTFQKVYSIMPHIMGLSCLFDWYILTFFSMSFLVLYRISLIYAFLLSFMVCVYTALQFLPMQNVLGGYTLIWTQKTIQHVIVVQKERPLFVPQVKQILNLLCISNYTNQY